MFTIGVALFVRKKNDSLGFLDDFATLLKRNGSSLEWSAEDSGWIEWIIPPMRRKKHQEFYASSKVFFITC